MKNIKLFGRTVPIAFILIAVLITGTVSAALVNYLSDTITQPVAVESPIELSGRIMYENASIGFEQSDGEHSRAAWSTNYANSGSYSIILHVDDIAYTADPLQFADVSIDVEDFALKAFEPGTTSFYCYSTEGTVIPRFVFELPGNYPDGGKLLVIYAYDSIPSTNYATNFAEFKPVADPTLEEYSWEVYTGYWDGWIAGDYALTWPALLTAVREYTGAAAYDGLTVDKVLVLLSASTEEETGPHTAYVDDIMINGVIYASEPETYAFDGVTPFEFYAGDKLTVNVDATNHANQGISLDIMLVLVGPDIEGQTNAWTYIDDVDDPEDDPIWLPPGGGPKHGCFASGIYEANITQLSDEMVYVTEGGVYTLAPVCRGSIGPGSSNRIGFEISVDPVLAPGEYTFHILAVTPFSEVADWYRQMSGKEGAAATAAALQQYIDDIIARIPPA